MALPLVSIFWIALKQLSKPISRSIAGRSQHNFLLRNYVLLPFGQFYHRFETTSRMWNQGFKRPKSIPPVTEETAIQYSSDFLSEFLIFLVAISPVLVTWYQSNHNDAKEKENREDDIDSIIENISTQLINVTMELERQSVDLRTLERRLGDLDTKVGNLQMKSSRSWLKFW